MTSWLDGVLVSILGSLCIAILFLFCREKSRYKYSIGIARFQESRCIKIRWRSVVKRVDDVNCFLEIMMRFFFLSRTYFHVHESLDASDMENYRILNFRLFKIVFSTLIFRAEMQKFKFSAFFISFSFSKNA